jgi:hypothetical protein
VTEDELEANHAAYNCCRIVRLSSGRFAVFSPWTNDDGIGLVALGTWAECERAVLSVEECSAAWEHAHALEQSRRQTLAQIIGVAQPQVRGLVRRV